MSIANHRMEGERETERELSFLYDIHRRCLLASKALGICTTVRFVAKRKIERIERGPRSRHSYTDSAVMTETPHTMIVLTTGDMWESGSFFRPKFAIVPTRLLPEAVRGVNKEVVYYSDEGEDIRHTARENGSKLDLTAPTPTSMPPITNVISLVGSDGFGGGEDF